MSVEMEATSNMDVELQKFKRYFEKSRSRTMTNFDQIFRKIKQKKKDQIKQRPKCYNIREGCPEAGDTNDSNTAD